MSVPARPANAPPRFWPLVTMRPGQYSVGRAQPFCGVAGTPVVEGGAPSPTRGRGLWAPSRKVARKLKYCAWDTPADITVAARAIVAARSSRPVKGIGLHSFPLGTSRPGG